MLVRLGSRARHDRGLRPRPVFAGPFGPSPAARLSLAALLLAAVGSSCRRPAVEAEGVELVWAVSPDPPRVGPAVVVLTLSDSAKRPVGGARWRIEGFMAHPGMAPVAARVEQAPRGGYEAHITFTMAGDWVLLAQADWPERGRIERRIPVRVVP
jgi:hypothetical protein